MVAKCRIKQGLAKCGKEISNRIHGSEITKWLHEHITIDTGAAEQAEDPERDRMTTLGKHIMTMNQHQLPTIWSTRKDLMYTESSDTEPCG